jgi:hypothetical protein
MPNYKIFNSNAKPVYSQITDGTYNLILNNGAALSIDSTHEEINIGNTYTANNYFSNVGDNNYADMHLIAGSTKAPHAQMFISTAGKSYIYLYRGATYSNSGTAVTIYNRNGESSNTTQSSVYYSPTISNSGTMVYQALLPGGKGKATVGGQTSSKSEAIFKYSNDYLLRVQNVSGGNSDIAIEINFYEI